MTSTTVVFDAQLIPETERADVVHEAVAQGFSPVEIGFAADRGPVQANFVLTDWGDLSVCSSVSSAVVLRRTAKLTRDDAHPSIFVAMQMAGSAVLAQHGRQVTVRPGDLIVYDSSSPWEMSDDDGMRQHKFRIPLDRMALSHDVIARICAVTLCPGDPIAHLAAQYFHRLAVHQTSFDGGSGEAMSRPSIELLRAVIATHDDASKLAREAMDTALYTRIMTYVRTHLRDLDLGADQIAAQHHISIRLLYKVLAAEGISLADWLRVRRLEECRKELARTGLDDSVAAIARRWGFTNASSFSRMFRAAFGVSPRQWREINYCGDRGSRDPFPDSAALTHTDPDRSPSSASRRPARQ